MSTMEIATVNDAPLVQQGQNLAGEIERLQVVDDATFQRAGALSVQLATWLKAAHEFFDPICDTTHKAWKLALDRRKSVIEPRETLKTALGERMAKWNEEQNRLRAEAEAAAQRERERLEAEARAQAEAEAERLRRDAEDARLAEAVVAEADGDTETAERLVSAPIFVPPVYAMPVFVAPVQIAKPQAPGISFGSTWSAKLTDMHALVKAAANGNATAISCLKFDEVRANGLARALKAAMKDGSSVPGVTSVETRGTKTRTT